MALSGNPRGSTCDPSVGAGPAIKFTQTYFFIVAISKVESQPDFMTQTAVLIIPQLGLAAEFFSYLVQSEAGRLP